MSRAHHKKIGRPDRWSSGRCERGHDVTLPDAVRVDGTARICVACRREKQREWARIRAASQRPTGPLFDRCVVCGGMKKAKSRRAVKTCGPKCLAELNRTSSHRAQLPRERQPNAVEMDKILELRARAETEPTWKRVQTITLAESIREHGLPSDYRSRRTPQRQDVTRNRARLLAATVCDAVADDGNRHPAPPSDGRDGGAVGGADEAATEGAEGGLAEADRAGYVLHRDTGAGFVQQVAERARALRTRDRVLWGAAASLLRPDPADPMIPLEEMRHP